MRIALVLAAVLAAAGPVSAQPWREQPDAYRGGGDWRPGFRPGSGALTLFADTGFRGRAVTLDRDAPTLAPLGFNDVASSAQSAGAVWELCEHEGFGGRCFQVGGAESDFPRLGANDTVSSARLVSDRRGRGLGRRDRDWDGYGGGRGYGGRGGGATLFEHEGLRGRAVSVSSEEPDLDRLGFNDQASSLSLGPGLWELCEHANFAGRCVRLSGDAYDLRGVGLHDRISSLRRVR